MFIFYVSMCRGLPCFATQMWQNVWQNLNGVYHFSGNLDSLFVGMSVDLSSD